MTVNDYICTVIVLYFILLIILGIIDWKNQTSDFHVGLSFLATFVTFVALVCIGTHK